MSQDRRHVLGVWWAPAVVLTVGFLIVVAGDRALIGGIVMGAGFALAAVLRLVLPEDRSGGLVVRTKVLDLVALVGLAVAVVVAFVLVNWTGSP
ncbi:MAG: DUF3017 domain-containing protein [Austwickia sp.]|nr:DUF3017 domain-containing protein [Actinomycetota bacterium]MCB1253322.1 DUF3017 domain-containing protein [Austwickia sp.]MCO5310343.1 DUF3017 domain-containing protein [Austwickia sp.]